MILSIKSLYVLEHVGSLSISTCYRHDKAEEVSFGVKLQPRTYFASSSFPSKIPWPSIVVAYFCHVQM
jgi:hypothetical protein